MTKEVNKVSNPFITAHFTQEEADALVKLALPLMADNGQIPWAKVEEKTGIKYSRGWLLVRWAWLNKNQPQALIPAKAKLAEAAKKAEEAGQAAEFAKKSDRAGSVTNGEAKVLSPLVHDLRDVKGFSWGEIAVRMQLPESYARRLYKANGQKKDIGLRIGRGGRYVYDDPTLYRDNRKQEGAHIKVDLVGRPKEEQLLNYKAPATKAPATKKATAKAS